jgi:hypothetical protein
MAAVGVEDWYDFFVEGNELLVLSRALATQKIINGRPRGRAQNIVSWIDLATGAVSPFLIPLDDRYLDAALSAGDAEIQYLDGLPDSEPALLTRVGDQPLVVSVGWVERRQVLRLQEASKDLKPFTEAMEKRHLEQAKTAARTQRKADREALREDILASQAAAAGMSVEEFQALSKAEQTEAVIRNGGAEQFMQSMQQQSEQLAAEQQARAASNQTAAPAEDINAQLATAMAQAQQEMANIPGMTPEMAAQMQAAMAQLSQGLGDGVPGSPGTTTVPAAAAAESAADDTSEILALDPGGRAFVEFEDEAGNALTLRIFERGSKHDLFRKDYADGVIYEYIDFTGFGLPLERVRIHFLDSQGSVLRELVPAVRP